MANYVVSIKRTFGIHAIPIAKAVAKDLGIAYYEDALLRDIAPEPLKMAIDELATLEGDDLAAATDNVFMMKSALIRSLAEKSDLLIVGKASDYVPNDLQNVIRINVNSNYEDCIKTVSIRDGLTEEEAAKRIHEVNEERAARYEKITGCVWNDPLGFDITLNSSKMGREHCVKLIARYIEILREEEAD